jgi:hypothetical protein
MVIVAVLWACRYACPGTGGGQGQEVCVRWARDTMVPMSLICLRAALLASGFLENQGLLCVAC